MTDLGATTEKRADKPDAPSLLASHRMSLPATFKFDYFDMPFDVGIRRVAGVGAELVVRGRLGNLPYTAESAAARKFMLSVVDAGQSVPMAEIKIDSRQNIIVRSKIMFNGAPSPAMIAAGAAAIAISVKPVCELIVKSRELRHRRG